MILIFAGLMVRLMDVVRVSVPEVPLIVTVAVPVVAVLLAMKVTELLDVAGFVPKEAVTPDGRPEADRLTEPVKPPNRLTVMVLLTLFPWVTLKLEDEAESEKPFTVSVMVVVLVSAPEVPLIVTVAVPAGAVLLAVKVTTLVEVVEFRRIDCVLNEAVTPLGRPEADSVTDPVKPFRLVCVMVLLPLLPGLTISEVGEAERVKPLTISVMVVVWVNEPEVPVTVMVLEPRVAVVLALKVTELLDVVGFVPKLAVTPAGRPEADRLTDPVKPLTGLTVTVLLPLPPRGTFKLEGEAERVKPFTVSVMFMEWVSVPEVPVIVTFVVPVGAVLLAVKVTTLVEVVGSRRTDCVLNEAVTPLGRPDADSVTDPVKP